ncbi:MAG: hypothetical protein ACE5EA_05495 [Nitrospirota bacterium]
MKRKKNLLKIVMLGCAASLLIGSVVYASPGRTIFGSLNFEFAGGRPVGLVMYNDIILRNPQISYQIPALGEINGMDIFRHTTAPWAQRIDQNTGEIRGDTLILLSNPGLNKIEVGITKYDNKGNEECMVSFVIKPHGSYFKALRQIFKNCP